MNQPTTDAASAAVAVPQAVDLADDASTDDALVEQELLVEDVSIDGMCGVY